MSNYWSESEACEQTKFARQTPSITVAQDREILAIHQVPVQLQAAQHDINNLRLLNICLQSTLIRVQTQLVEYLPANAHDEIKRNETKQKLVLLRHADDHSRRVIDSQNVSFSRIIDSLKTALDSRQQQQQKLKSNRDISLTKVETQIDILHAMFHELNTIIHTEHNDRISQLYITLAQASHSVNQAHETLDKTIQAQKIITHRKLRQTVLLAIVALTFISILIFIAIINIRLR